MFTFLFSNRAARHIIHGIMLFYMHRRQFDETVKQDVLITTRRVHKSLQFKRCDDVNG